LIRLLVHCFEARMNAGNFLASCSAEQTSVRGLAEYVAPNDPAVAIARGLPLIDQNLGDCFRGED
jgi:hypothetical protein